MKNIVAKTLKRLRLYGIATGLLARWRPIQPWGQAARQRRIMLRFFSSLLKKGDSFFDIGANVGERTEPFKRLGATVMAVEAQDVCVRQPMWTYKGRSKVKKVLGMCETAL